MTNQEIIMQVKNKMIEYSCILRYTYSKTGERLKGKIIAESDTILFLYDNKKKFLTSFDANLGHGNFRNTLAKQFIELFTLEEIQQDYENFQEKKYQESLENEKQAEKDIEYFENLIPKLKTIVNIGNFDIHNSYEKKELNWNYRTKEAPDYPYKLNYSAYLKIIRQDNMLNIKYNYCDNGYSGISDDYILNESDFLEFFEQKISIMQNTLDKIQAERSKIDLQKQAEIELQNFCYRIVRDKQAHIFKTKQGYFCVNGNVRYSLKGAGKYYNIDGCKLYSLIVEKGITQYYDVPEGVETWDIRDKLEELGFKNIA